MRNSRFNSFSELAKIKKEGVNYQITERSVDGSSIAVIALHGKIEPKTELIAQAIAGDEYNLYIFCGMEKTNNFYELHVTSNNFDEPRCLTLVSRCEHAISIHGYQSDEPKALIGGKDAQLKQMIKEELEKAGIACASDNHPFPGDGDTNPCNRTSRSMGAQIELSKAIRDNEELRSKVISAVRDALKKLV